MGISSTWILRSAPREARVGIVADVAVISLVGPSGADGPVAAVRRQKTELTLEFAGKKAVLPSGHRRTWEHVSVVAGVIRAMTDQECHDLLSSRAPGSEGKFWKRVANCGKWGLEHVQEDGDSLFRVAAEVIQMGTVQHQEGLLRKSIAQAMREIPGFTRERLLEAYDQVVVEGVMST